MASSSHLWLPTITPLRRPAAFRRAPFSFPSRRLACFAMKDLLGDFGARDPFPAEVESNFADKILGCTDTEHKILIPNLSALSLSRIPLERSPRPLAIDDAYGLMKKIVGWRMVEVDGTTFLRCVWKVRDYGCGVQLIGRIALVAGEAGHYPNLHLEQPNVVTAELCTQSAGGLSINDFILAAKIDEINVLDLVPKKRIWA